MDELKNAMSYQVYFTSNPTSIEKSLFLTFFFRGKPVPIPDDKNLLPLLSKSTQISDNSFRIPNIVDISPNMDLNLREYYSSFFCVLFSERKAKRNELKEKGFLIGKSVHSGYFIIGVWPYPFFLESEANLENLGVVVKEVCDKAKAYTEILLLTEK